MKNALFFGAVGGRNLTDIGVENRLSSIDSGINDMNVGIADIKSKQVLDRNTSYEEHHNLTSSVNESKNLANENNILLKEVRGEQTKEKEFHETYGGNLLIGGFVTGAITSLTASWIWKKCTGASDKKAEDERDAKNQADIESLLSTRLGGLTKFDISKKPTADFGGQADIKNELVQTNQIQSDNMSFEILPQPKVSQQNKIIERQPNAQQQNNEVRRSNDAIEMQNRGSNQVQPEPEKRFEGKF